MAKQYNYKTCTRAQSEAMSPSGMDREAIKKAILKKLAIGQQYRLKSVNATSKDYPVSVICTLMDLNRNVVVFKHKNGTLESFTYQEIWTQMMCGDFI